MQQSLLLKLVSYQNKDRQTACVNSFGMTPAHIVDQQVVYSNSIKMRGIKAVINYTVCGRSVLYLMSY